MGDGEKQARWRLVVGMVETTMSDNYISIKDFTRNMIGPKNGHFLKVPNPKE